MKSTAEPHIQCIYTHTVHVVHTYVHDMHAPVYTYKAARVYGTVPDFSLEGDTTTTGLHVVKQALSGTNDDEEAEGEGKRERGGGVCDCTTLVHRVRTGLCLLAT